MQLVFVDFSSAFNYFQSNILAERLSTELKIVPGLICCLLGFLTRRSQSVRVNGTCQMFCSAPPDHPRGVSFHLCYLYYIQIYARANMWGVKLSSTLMILLLCTLSVVTTLNMALQWQNSLTGVRHCFKNQCVQNEGNDHRF